MQKRTFRLPAGLNRALSQHAKAQRVAAAVIVRDALSAYLLLESSSTDVARQLGLLCEQQRILTEHMAAFMGGRSDASQASTPVVRSSNPVLQRLQQQLKDETPHGT